MSNARGRYEGGIERGRNSANAPEVAFTVSVKELEPVTLFGTVQLVLISVLVIEQLSWMVPVKLVGAVTVTAVDAVLPRVTERFAGFAVN